MDLFWGIRQTGWDMKYSFGDEIVVALGGSIVYPEEIDVEFLRKFKALVEEFVEAGKRFVIVVGGGKICRVYQNAAKEITPLGNLERDLIGIEATRTNAQLLHAIFGSLADPVVLDEKEKINELKHAITVGSGCEPGESTDFDAAMWAEKFGISEFIVAGKPDYVYDKDPSEHEDAKRIDKIDWAEYRKIIPDEFTPGLSTPVDPVASKFSEENGLKAIVLDGRELDNLRNLINGEEFKGTLIE